MQKPALILLLLTLVAVIAGALYIPGMLSETEAPVMHWDASEEVDGSEEEPEPVSSESGAFERTEATLVTAAPSADETPRIDAILRGRVINKFQQPVAGAKVWLEIARSRQSGRGSRGNRGRSRAIPEPVLTNKEGLFAFQGQAFRNLRVSLQVRHANHAVGLFNKDIGDIQTSAADFTAAVEVEIGDLVLKSGGMVRGRVTDLDGNPVANAEIKLRPEGRNRLRWQRNRNELLPPVKTDNNGYYAFPNVPAEDNNSEFAVTALAKMHTEGRSSRFRVEADQTYEVADIRLGPGYNATGFVRDSHGLPIANADVTVRSSRPRDNNRNTRGGPRGGFFGRGSDHRTKTDDTGRFFLAHLPGAESELLVRAQGFLDHEQKGLDLKLGQLIHVTMQAGLRITGTVQTPDGNPVTSYAMRTVRLRALPNPNTPEMDLNEVMAKLADGSLNEQDRSQLMRQMRTLRNQNGQRGRGRNQGRWGGRGDNNLGSPEPHPDGRFLADGLQEGIYEVHLQAAEFARFKSAEIAVSTDMATADLTITVDPGVYVAGVVLNDRGNPIAFAKVELRTSTLAQSGQGTGTQGFDFNRIARAWGRRNSGTALRLDARTDEDGLFVLKHVQRGVFQLTASADGYADERTDAFKLETPRSNFEFTLQPLGSIVGTVVGFRPEELGQVHVGAVVMPAGGGMANMSRGRAGREGFKTARVEADGSYRLDDLTPGNYVVRSWVGSSRQLMRELGPDFLAGTLQADVTVRGGQDVKWNIALTRPQVGIVAGTVRHNGEAANGFRVELRKQDDGQSQPAQPPGGRGRMSRMFGRNLRATVSTSGQFKIKDVPAGLYDLRITASRRGRLLRSEPIQVFANDTLELSYAVQTASLEGSITADDGVDPKTIGGRVSMVFNQASAPENLNQWLRENESFDAPIRDGAFAFETLPAGSYLLVLQPRGRATTTQQVVVSGAEIITLTVGPVSEQQDPAGGPGGR